MQKGAPPRGITHFNELSQNILWSPLTCYYPLLTLRKLFKVAFFSLLLNRDTIPKNDIQVLLHGEREKGMSLGWHLFLSPSVS
jgi:hypothetical protein